MLLHKPLNLPKIRWIFLYKLYSIGCNFLWFLFLIIRPQSKKFKDHQKMVNELKVGNKIVTTGGIVGVVKDCR